jgi:hypothetical protein
VSGDGEDGTGELLLTNLSKFVRYTIVAQCFNQVGPGPLSEPISVQTLEDGEFNLFPSKITKFQQFFYHSAQ